MGRLAALRTAQVTTATTVAGNSTQAMTAVKERAKKTQQTQLGKIAAYIPSEAVSFYIAGLAIVAGFPAEAKLGGLWGVVAIAVVANFALTLIAFRQTIKGTVGGALSSSRFWITIVLATVALAVYAVALPENPFLGDAYYLSPLILLAGVLIIPLVASLAKLNPEPEDS